MMKKAVVLLGAALHLVHGADNFNGLISNRAQFKHILTTGCDENRLNRPHISKRKKLINERSTQNFK